MTQRQMQLEAAIDEVDREAKVRQRCYPKWVEEGRVTKTDARDRLARILDAGRFLAMLLAAPEEILNSVIPPGLPASSTPNGADEVPF